MKENTDLMQNIATINNPDHKSAMTMWQEIKNKKQPIDDYWFKQLYPIITDIPLSEIDAAQQLCQAAGTNVSTLMNDIIEQLLTCNKTDNVVITIANPVYKLQQAKDLKVRLENDRLRETTINLLAKAKEQKKADHLIGLKVDTDNEKIAQMENELNALELPTLSEIFNDLLERLLVNPAAEFNFVYDKTKILELKQWLTLRELHDIKGA